MNLLGHLQQLYAHMEWADSLVWRVAIDTVQGDGDEFILERLRHVHVVQRAFLAVWRGEEPAFPQLDAFKGLRDVAQWGRAYYAELYPHLASLQESDLERRVDLPWAGMVEEQLGRPPEATNLAETLQQVAAHSTYHRGQVNSRLRQLGATPPLVDFIAWLWMGKPAADWPV